ncbi:MAG: WG repeat-containing protein [Bacteroidota bacterium]
MKGLTLLFCLVCMHTILFSQDYETFEEKGKWGFKQGKKTVIKARFDAASNFWASSPHTMVRMGNKYGVIDRKGKWFIEPGLDSVLHVTFPHNYDLDGKWIIAYGKEYDYILDNYDYRKLDSFPEIQREIQVREKNPYFNADYSDPKDEYMTYFTPPEEPYVVVSRFDERRQPERALYELTGQKLISPWVPLGYDENLEVEAHHYDTVTLYIYSNGTEKGYYMTGMDSGTKLKFSDMTVDGNFVLIREAAKGSPFQLYQWAGEYLLLLSGTNNVVVSLEEGSARYFYLLDDGKGHYGFVSMGGKVVEPQYDSLFRMPGYSDILHTRINGMYGIVSLSSDYELRAKSQVPVKIEGYSYTLFNSGIYLSYIDDKGKKWFADATLEKQYAFNPRYVFPKAEKGFYYLASRDTVLGKPLETRVTGSKFLHLEATGIPEVFKVKGTNKKYGFVNLKGDTLTPLEFEDVNLFNWDGDGNQYIRVKQNGKWALYHYKSRQLVPVYYDHIRNFDFNDYTNLVITKKNGKEGVNNQDGLEILPHEFDEIYSLHSREEYGNYIIGMKTGQYHVMFLKNNYISEAASFPVKAYDLILGDFGYIKNGEKYDRYSLFDHQLQNSVTAEEITDEDRNNTYVIRFQDGKFGVTDKEGNLLVPYEYDLACFQYLNTLIAYKNGARFYVDMDTNTARTREEHYKIRE